MKDISIIIPFHKGLFYLEECLDSILLQELPEDSYEVICLGDSPEEGIVSCVERYETKGVPIRYIQWMEKKGTGYARNKGLDMAEGEYIYFLDCDDYLTDGCLSKLLSCAKEQSSDIIRGDIADTFFKRKSTDIEDINKQCLISSDRKGTDALLSVMFIKEITVLNMLIKKSFIDKIQAAFPDNVLYFCDMPFVMDLFSNTDKVYFASGAVLCKRERNDPIHFPSLTQSMINDQDRMLSDLLSAYKEAYTYTDDNFPKRRNTLNRLLCENIVKICVNGWKVSERQAGAAASAVRYARRSAIRGSSFLERNILAAIARKRFRLSKLFAALIVAGQKKDGLFGSKIQWFRLIDKIIFRRMKRKNNWIVFESFFGRGYNDSPKYIYEYMRDRYGDRYRYIWVLNDPPKAVKKQVKTVKMTSLSHVYYSTRAKYHIYNVRQPGWFRKEEDMVFVETWHGTPLKKLAFDLEDVHLASKDHKSEFYKDTRVWDYLVSANRFSTEVFEHAFDVDKNIIIETGYPRNDILFSRRGVDIAAKVKKGLGIPSDKKVILYAPTWRDNSFFEPGKYKFELELDLDLMKEELGDEWVVLLRLHYHIANNIDISAYKGFVYNASSYSDISRLYLISDVCLTDYSSVFFDYANLRRPVLFFVYDYEEYKDELRGMYLDMETELPGPMLKTSREVVDAVKNIQSYDMRYRDRYNQFCEKYCSFDDGNASKRIAEIVFEGKERSSY